MTERTIIEILNDAIESNQADTHTITLGKITKVNDSTISAQPILPRMLDGVVKPLPEIPDIPIIWFSGGSSYETWPLAVGDPCVLFVMERCTDAALNSQDNEAPPDNRMHNLSDVFAVVGWKTYSDGLSVTDVIHRVGDMLYEGDVTHTGNTIQTGNQTTTGNISATEFIQSPIIRVGAVDATQVDTRISAPLRAENGITYAFTAAGGQVCFFTDGIFVNYTLPYSLPNYLALIAEFTTEILTTESEIVFTPFANQHYAKLRLAYNTDDKRMSWEVTVVENGSGVWSYSYTNVVGDTVDIDLVINSSTGELTCTNNETITLTVYTLITSF